MKEITFHREPENGPPSAYCYLKNSAVSGKQAIALETFNKIIGNINNWRKVYKHRLDRQEMTMYTIRMEAYKLFVAFTDKEAIQNLLSAYRKIYPHWHWLDNVPAFLQRLSANSKALLHKGDFFMPLNTALEKHSNINISDLIAYEENAKGLSITPPKFKTIVTHASKGKTAKAINRRATCPGCNKEDKLYKSDCKKELELCEKCGIILMNAVENGQISFEESLEVIYAFIPILRKSICREGMCAACGQAKITAKTFLRNDLELCKSCALSAGWAQKRGDISLENDSKEKIYDFLARKRMK